MSFQEKDKIIKEKSKEGEIKQQKLEQESQLQEEDSEEDGPQEIIRGKWMLDESWTLDEVIEALEKQKEYIRELKKEYELIGEIKDDYGFLRKIKENSSGEIEVKIPLEKQKSSGSFSQEKKKDSQGTKNRGEAYPTVFYPTDKKEKESGNKQQGKQLQKEIIIRGKWMLDGSKTLDDVIEALEKKKEYIRELKKEGYELVDVFFSDYGFAKKQKNSGLGKLSSQEKKERYQKKIQEYQKQSMALLTMFR